MNSNQQENLFHKVIALLAVTLMIISILFILFLASGYALHLILEVKVNIIDIHSRYNKLINYLILGFGYWHFPAFLFQSSTGGINIKRSLIFGITFLLVFLVIRIIISA